MLKLGAKCVSRPPRSQTDPAVVDRPLDTGRLLSVAGSRLTLGWNWVSQNTARFLPSDPSDPETMKPLSELALVYAFTFRWLGLEIEAFHSVGEFLWGSLQGAEMSHLLRKRPAYYNAYSFPYLALRMTGKHLDHYEEALASVHRAGFPGVCEKIPFRAMELEYLRWRAGLTRRQPDWESHYRATTLGRCKSPAYLVNWEVYSITHTLFYWTDFSGPPSKIPYRQRRRAASLLEILLVNYWRRSNWDIAGELLLNLVALDRRHTPLFRLCTETLLKAWRSDGALPGPKFALENGQPGKDYIFERCYHTTLVGLLLCGAFVYRSIGPRKEGGSAKT